MNKLFIFVKKRKVISGLIIVGLIAGGYFSYKAIRGDARDNPTYISSVVEKGTIVVSVSGAGQVLSLNEVDIKAKAVGEIIYLGMENGKTVQRGALLAKVDASSLEEEIDNAKEALAEAQLVLDKMNGLTTSQGVLRGVKEKAIDALDKSYEDGFNNVSDVFLNLPSVMAGLSDMLFSYDYVSSQWNIDYYNDVIRIYDFEADIYRTDAYDKYQIARKSYDQNIRDYKLISRTSDKKTIEALIEQTYQTMQDISEVVRSANNLIQFYQDKLIGANKSIPTLSNTHLTNLSGYTSKVNSYLSSLLSSGNSIKSNIEVLIETDFDINNQITKKAKAEESLLDLQNKLADYMVVAPLSGIIVSANAKKGDSVSSGSTLGSIITKQKIAEISLNEVDASKVRVGQKVTLTFDAIDDLTITGSVFEVDSLGTVSQGVVSYDIKISFDAQDERVKTGMSVSASIVVDIKQDVVIVPNAAIKSQDDINYVEIMATSSVPQANQVVIGIADDSFTEIISGLLVGDAVITKTIDDSSKATPQATGSILNVGGGNVRTPGSMGGGFR